MFAVNTWPRPRTLAASTMPVASVRSPSGPSSPRLVGGSLCLTVSAGMPPSVPQHGRGKRVATAGPTAGLSAHAAPGSALLPPDERDGCRLLHPRGHLALVEIAWGLQL